MRFGTDDKAELLEFLPTDPIVLRGGAHELCEMPRSRGRRAKTLYSKTLGNTALAVPSGLSSMAPRPTEDAPAGA
jgi:hypothetical protein